MKLFLIAGLIAVSAAARLEHLERGYLPPVGGQNDAPGPNGIGANGRPGNRVQGPGSYGTQAAPFGAATSNQYLPPGQDQGPNAGSNALGSGPFGSSCCQTGQPGLNNNQGPFGAQPGLGGQPGSGNQPDFGNLPGLGLPTPFGTKPSSQYGTPQFGAAANDQRGPGVGASNPRPAFGSQYQPSQYQPSQYQPSQYQPSQYSATNSQYPTPKSSSNNFQNIPQQDFDDETGYHY